MKQEERLENFNKTGNDAEVIVKEELETLPPALRFEKTYPFYLMDINGFIVEVKKAMRLENTDPSGEKLHEVKSISFGGMKSY